jgi:flagellar motility protein MotE (MotC chaperone)
MRSLARMGLFAAIPAAVFAGALAATLAVQGRLSRATLAKAPVLGKLFAHGGAPHAASNAASAPEKGDSHAKKEAGDRAAFEQAFELPRPFEAEELEALVARLAEARESYEKKAEAAAAERQAIVALGRDLEERRSDLERIMAALANEKAALDAERAALGLERSRMEELQSPSVRQLVKTYEEMQPDAAAERLGKLDPEAAAEILASIKPRKAAKVLEATEAARAAELSRRLAKLGRSGEEPAKEEGHR